MNLETVPGLPESALAPADLALLPDAGPGAPWDCRARALVWAQRSPAPEHAWFGHPVPLCTVAFVEYLDSPVGPYHEVLAAAALRRGLGVAGQIPFIAVDSLPSVRGGRANWGLPKTMARFDGDIASARMAVTGGLGGVPWSLSVQPLSPPRGPDLPLRVRFRAVGPLGAYRTTLRARGHRVRVRTEASGPVIGDWIGDGEHTAVLCEGTMRIEEPR